MSAEYYVTQKLSCQNCNEKGLIQNPIWKKYWDWYYGNDPAPTFKTQHEWWADNGYSENDTIPEDEISCPDCNGEGFIENRTTLTDALVDIQETLNILVGHRDED